MDLSQRAILRRCLGQTNRAASTSMESFHPEKNRWSLRWVPGHG